MLATKLPDWETFGILIGRGVHKPCALLNPTSSHNASTMYFNMLEL